MDPALVLGLAVVAIVALTLVYVQRRRTAKAERAHRASEDRFRAIVESTQEWIWEADASGLVTYSNPASTSLLGVAPSEMIGRHILSQVHPDGRDEAGARWQAAMTGSRAWKDVLLRRLGADGVVRYFESHATPILDAHGAIVGCRGADRDVTERKHAESMKSDFVSFVSHQLRTPLCGVSWMLELAAETPGLPTEAAEHVAEARDSARRLIRLVNDLLDVSRLASGRIAVNPQYFCLGDLAVAVAADLAHYSEEKGQRLTIAPHAGSTVVYADPKLMRQALANLLVNAIKYTPSGGRVDVGVANVDGAVICAIRDTGIGVPSEAQSRLFERFFRAGNAAVVESEGTGLGLHFVRLAVEQFGGRVWHEPAPGGGAVFTVALAAQDASLAVRGSAGAVVIAV
jgi:PAS domain S-box-containing protein